MTAAARQQPDAAAQIQRAQETEFYNAFNLKVLADVAPVLVEFASNLASEGYVPRVDDLRLEPDGPFTAVCFVPAKGRQIGDDHGVVNAFEVRGNAATGMAELHGRYDHRPGADGASREVMLGVTLEELTPETVSLALTEFLARSLGSSG